MFFTAADKESPLGFPGQPTLTFLHGDGFGLIKELVEVIVVDYIRENNIKVPFSARVFEKDWRFLVMAILSTKKNLQHLSKRRTEVPNPEIGLIK